MESQFFLVILLCSIFTYSQSSPQYQLVNGYSPVLAYDLFGLGQVGQAVNNVVSGGLGKLANPIHRIVGGGRKRPHVTTTTTTDVYAQTHMTMCYFLGDDVVKSHLIHNSRWVFDKKHLEGLNTYINDLTLATNMLLGLHNYKLKWKGPYERSDKAKRYPDNLAKDTYSTINSGCDVVVFLVFNDFTNTDSTDGHTYSGFAKGGPCENHKGSGYTVIVDQGFLGKVWMGPQVLAHHLLLMLTSDLYGGNRKESRHCPNKNSLLHDKIDAGKQILDQCIVSKLNRSQIGLRKCLLDN